ncbi:MAG: ADP-glyceromanno-heptose 6-epimerase [Spartobacteria bacterium]|nr:ADP-glyceromanno-heptose 6-epimerase [Spartobacteria bacterium]
MKDVIIVTGGAGFIGSNLVRALNERGEDNIIIVDHLGCGEKWRNLQGLRFENYIAKEEFRAALWDDRDWTVKTVFHLGACSATTELDADYLADNNYHYTRELCEWCLRHDTRFIYASSAATYGDGAKGYSDEDRVTPTLAPLNMYGYSKHMFDLWALRYHVLDHVAGIKYFNVYGPGEAHKEDMRSVVHKAYGQIRDTGQVRLFKSCKPEYGDGEQVRDFLYVKDAVDLTLFFHDHPEVSGLFNCGAGQARSWNDLVKAVFAAMEREPAIDYIDMPAHLRDKYQYFTQADMQKVHAAGYTQPFATLEDGIRDYVQNYLVPEAVL